MKFVVVPGCEPEPVWWVVAALTPARVLLGLLSLLVLARAAAAGPPRDFRAVRSFVCQLQNLDLKQLETLDFDLLITDYSSDGSAAGRFSATQVAQMQRGPQGRRRLVLAYLSIGEAEDYRFYWRADFRAHPPAWLGEENPEWPGNFKVRYWDPGWQAILHRYLEQIVAAGFDGVYLDIVDAYEHYQDKGRTTARREMIQLVQALAREARARGGADFGVVPQNAEELVSEPGYLAVITGLGKEDTFFGFGGGTEATPPESRAFILGCLRRVVAAGKPVFNLDYPDLKRDQDIREAYRLAGREGLLEYVAERGLDRVCLVPGLQPGPAGAVAVGRPVPTTSPPGNLTVPLKLPPVGTPESASPVEVALSPSSDIPASTPISPASARSTDEGGNLGRNLILAGLGLALAGVVLRRRRPKL